jgi:hypothetical protein
MKKKYLFLLAIPLLLAGCKDDESIDSTPQIIKVLSSAADDGYVTNSSPRMVNVSDKTLDMGWRGGKAMRAFLSFDISSIQSSNKLLVIDDAVLKVYESNTNMLPFSGEGVDRVVEAYLLPYSSLDAADFDVQNLSNCGVLTNCGFSVLKEYTLDVTDNVDGLQTSYPDDSKLQFRLQFTHNDNVSASSTLSQAMWRIFSGEEQESNKNKYRPVIEITYHYEKK